MSTARAEIVTQPNSPDPAALSYEGGAVATLDFTPEVERRKVVCSTKPNDVIINSGGSSR